jgi:hypothetical protein
MRIMTQIIKKYYNVKTNEEITIYPWTETKIKIKVHGQDWLEMFEEVA